MVIWCDDVDVRSFKGIVQRVSVPKRTRYVKDSELTAFCEKATVMMGCAAMLTYLTSLRRGDVCRISRSDLTDEGILLRPSKTKDTTGVTLLIEWSDELHAVVRRALAEPPQVRQVINCNQHGKPYSKNGMDTAWAGSMAEYVKAGGKPFTLRDLRKKSLTDEPELEDASQRAGHASTEITERVYRLKPRRVKPLR